MTLSRAHRFSPTILVGLLVLSACGDDDTASDAGATQSTRIAEVAATPVASSTPTTVAATTTAAASGMADQAVTTALTPTSMAVQSPEEVLEELTEDQIAGVGGRECALELAAIGTAFRQFLDEHGIATTDAEFEPPTIDELFDGGYLSEPLRLWELVDLRLGPQPKPSSGCINPQTSATCKEQARVLAIARLAHLQGHPDGAEPTQTDLLDAGLIDETVASLDLVDGAVVADPGEPCDGIDVALDWEQECVNAARTMETAREAYRAQEGNPPASEGDLVPMIRSESPLVDLAGETVVPAPGGPCEGIDLS